MFLDTRFFHRNLLSVSASLGGPLLQHFAEEAASEAKWPGFSGSLGAWAQPRDLMSLLCVTGSLGKHKDPSQAGKSCSHPQESLGQ